MITQPITSEQLNQIHEDCGGSLEATAAHLGIPYAVFATTLGPRLVPAPFVSSPRHRKPPTNLGQDWCRKHIIAIRHCENPEWARADEPAIRDARAKYELGTHEILTGRDRDYFILYLVPRNKRTSARRFFQVF